MTTPLDYSVNDVPPEEDHDDPYDRCPLCNALIGGCLALIIGLSLCGGSMLIVRVLQ